APVNMARIRSVRMSILCGMHSIPTDALAGRERGHWPLTTGDACLIRRSAGPETSAATGTWGMRGLSMKTRFLFVALMLWSAVPPIATLQSGSADPQRAKAGCEPAGSVKFICGVVSPEDLVPVPRSEWVIVSGYTGGAVHLANTRDHSTIQVYPTPQPRERIDKTTYASCPGPLDPAEKEKFSAHGLAVAQGANQV